MEFVTLKQVPKEFKLQVLKSLGLDVNDHGFVTKNGEPVIDQYIDRPVKFDNMAIFPGSTIVIDDNPLSIASYVEEHGEIT